METRQKAPIEAVSGPSVEAFRQPRTRIGRGIEARHAQLRLRAGWLDGPVGARLDPTIVRRRVSSGVCATAAASVGLEPAKAGAPSARTKRGGDCPLASRIMAATKKRASNAKLAWFSSTKAASCCSLCDDESGRRKGVPPCNARRIDAIESRPSQPSLVRRGHCDWDCTTSCWITTRERRISFSSCSSFTPTCVAPSSWCGIACRRIVPLRDSFWPVPTRGFSWNGFRHTLLTSIRSSMFGTRRNMGAWRTSFPTMYTTCTPRWTTSLTRFDINPTASIRSSKPPS
jgi:hypothetical protein